MNAGSIPSHGPPVERAEPLLMLKKVSKSFGALRALNEVDLTIYPGEIQALVGDNGAGKSTLVKTISGAHKADKGEILLQGQAGHHRQSGDAFALGIATVYQDLALIGTRDVAHNLFVGREPTRWAGGRPSPDGHRGARA